MKKNLMLLVLLVIGFACAGCIQNQTSDLDYEVLKVSDLSDKEINIKFMVRSGVISKALQDELIPGFYNSDLYKNNNLKINVEISALSGGYDTLRETIMLDINSNSAPDLIIGYPDHFAEYYSGGALVDLMGFIDNKDVGYTDDEMKDFLESYLKENRGYSAENPDDLYGLPFNKSTEVLIYNKTAFQALFGENYLAKVPETWDQVASVGKEIVDKVKAGELDSTFVKSVNPDTQEKTYLKVSEYFAEDSTTKFVPFGYDSSDNAFITFARQFKGAYTERETTEKGYVKFDNAQVKQALTYFRKMTTDGYFGNATTFGADYCSDAVALIQCIMTVGSSAGIGYNASSNSEFDYELGCAPVPYYTSDAKYVIQQGTNIAMLNQNTDEEKLAAWLFIKYLMEPENTALFAITTGGYLPVRKSAYETTTYSEFLTEPTDDQIHFSAVANTALYGYIEKGYTFFVDDAFVGSAKIRSEAGKIFDATVILGEDISSRLTTAYATLGSAFQ